MQSEGLAAHSDGDDPVDRLIAAFRARLDRGALEPRELTEFERVEVAARARLLAEVLTDPIVDALRALADPELREAPVAELRRLANEAAVAKAEQTKRTVRAVKASAVDPDETRRLDAVFKMAHAGASDRAERVLATLTGEHALRGERVVALRRSDGLRRHRVEVAQGREPHPVLRMHRPLVEADRAEQADRPPRVVVLLRALASELGAAGGDEGVLTQLLERVAETGSDAADRVADAIAPLLPSKRRLALLERRGKLPNAAFAAVVREARGEDRLALAREFVPAPLGIVGKTGPMLALEKVVRLLHDPTASHADAARRRGFAIGHIFTRRIDPFANLQAALDGTLVSAHALRLLQAGRRDGAGLVMMGTHHRPVAAGGLLPAIVASELGLETLSITVGNGAATSTTNTVWTAEGGASVATLGRSDGLESERVHALMSTLRRGGVVDLLGDHVDGTTVRQLAYVPWFLRPRYLPVFPAQAALATGARLACKVSCLDGEGRARFEARAVELPPAQGTLVVRAIWATQRYARAQRRLQRETGVPLHSPFLDGCGGVPSEPAPAPSSALSPRPSSAPDDVRRTASSLSAWIGEDVGDEPALSIAGRTTTRAQLARAARRMIAVLQDAQHDAWAPVDRRDRFTSQHRVMSVLSRGETAIAVALAAHASGTLLAPSQPDMPAAELARRLEDFEPHLVIAEASAWSAVLAEDPAHARFPVLICADGAGPDALDDLTDSYEPVDTVPRPLPWRPGFALYTSGSTGRSKGVVVPAGLMEGAGGLDRVMEFAVGTRVAYWLRWDTIGLSDLLACLRGGACLCVPPERMEGGTTALVRWVADEGVTLLSATVTLWRLLAAGSRALDELTALREGVLWGERIPAGLVGRLAERLPNVRLHAEFGSTEATYIAFGPIDPEPLADARGSYGGVRLPDVSVMIDEGRTDGAPAHGPDGVGAAEPDTARPGAREGVPTITGPGVMIGTVAGLREADPIIRAEDWPRTVRIENHVRLSVDQRIDVLARTDDVLKIDGRRITLGAVERSAEGVDGVRSAVAIGRVEGGDGVDEGVNGGGDRIVLAVEADERPGLAEAVGMRVVENHFAAARPRRVLVLDRFPVLGNGKVDRIAIAARLDDRAGGNDAEGHDPSEMSPREAGNGDEYGEEGVSATNGRPAGSLERWAWSRGLAPSGRSLHGSVPTLSSIELVELHMLAEEAAGAPLSTPLRVDEATTWEDLAAACHGTPSTPDAPNDAAPDHGDRPHAA